MYIYYYKDIVFSINVMVERIELNNVIIIFEVLNCVVSENEILNVMKWLKRNKLYGIDFLMNEYFID